MGKAVSNSVAHFYASAYGVSVGVDDAELRERVEDDGKGFDPHGGKSVWHNDRR